MFSFIIRKRADRLIIYYLVPMLFITLSLFLVSATTAGNLQDCESGTTWIDNRYTNTSSWTVGAWFFQACGNHYQTRSDQQNHTSSGSHSIYTEITNDAACTPKVSYYGTRNLTDFYMSAWFMWSDGAFGTSTGNRLKIFSFRKSGSLDQYLHIVGIDSSSFTVDAFCATGGLGYLYPFDATNKLIKAGKNKWVQIKLRYKTGGYFDMWLDGHHVAKLNSKIDGTGEWRTLPDNSWPYTQTIDTIRWVLNLSGGAGGYRPIFYMDDFYYGAEDTSSHPNPPTGLMIVQ